MLFEDNSSLQKWYMKNTPPEIVKHDKNATPCENIPRDYLLRDELNYF